jgi:hypothetical protein
VAESHTEKQVRLILEKQVRELADGLRPKVPREQGFILLLFDHGPGNVAYISTADREGSAVHLRTLLSKWERDKARKPAQHLTPDECPCCHKCLAPGADTDRALVVAFVSGLAARGVHDLVVGELLCEKHAGMAREAAAFVLAMSRGAS